MKQKTNFYRKENGCHYLASVFSSWLLDCNTLPIDEKLDRQTLCRIAGSHIKTSAECDIETFASLLPLTDIEPRSTRVIQNNAAFLCKQFGLEEELASAFEVILVFNTNHGLKDLIHQLCLSGEEVLNEAIETRIGFERNFLSSKIQPLIDCGILEYGTLEHPICSQVNALYLPFAYSRLT
ncbi:hypothetical protein D5018_20795 [Parashewanella curva]|uniref:Uncharacterized protein n=1 Tax=Parashewanella curva TaxID=2338552 RepID=A0A3L8PQY5_9GAMM|nr:hypothetical protein [Parashewanella curva]RLV57765.1 hypothetical protein D5018_20795 [Parashewanella curva]